MRFYLVYKNHGLYDPMLDDSEDYYVPIEQDELDPKSNVEKQTQEKKESVDQENGSSIQDSSEKEAQNLEDLLKLNLNYKNVFPELNLEELPPQTKYKLPVSKHYDPEGKLVKQQEVFNKNVIVDYETIKKLVKEREYVTQKESLYKKEVYEQSVVKKEEVREEHHTFNVLEKEIELRKVKQTALQVIEDNINKAISMTDKLNNKSGILQNKYTQDEEYKRIFEQSNIEKVKSEPKKVTFKDDYEVRESKLSDETSKSDVRVSKEIKRYEKFDLPMDSKLNAEERKLLTRLDIAESIEAGTVRQRTGMFKADTDKIMANKLEKKVVETVKSDVKTNVELTKQNVYKIGFQVIPRIRNSVQFSHKSGLILKRFLSQMTKVMMTLYRFIPLQKRYNYTKSKEFYELGQQRREYTKKIDVDDAAFTGSTFDESKVIRRPKLSGAKIAQIEGLKPAELTDRMNVVISEFLRKSGKDDSSEETDYYRSQTSSSTTDSTTKDGYMGSSFRDESFDKWQTEEEFRKDSPYRDSPYSNKKMFEETYETKTQSYEIREMKEEKRSSESKTAKVHSYDSEFTHKDNIPLTYIAIVEAHVYTNRNAIFEEQKRRMSESMKQSNLTETGVIYYRCEVSVFYRQFREPSLPPTVVIESIEEIPSEQVFEEEKQEILQESSTVYEDAAKKLAVQKISEVVEPLLAIKEVKSVTVKQAYPAIERSMKVAVETSEIKEEESRGLIEIFETDERKSKSIVEPTTKSIAETAEIFIEEETVGMIDVPLPIVQFPQRVKIERPIKSVAETSEVMVDQAIVEIIDIPKTISTTPKYTMANNLHTIAETMIAIAAEPKSESIEEFKIKEEKVKIGVDEIIASEVFEIFPQEPVHEEVIQTEIKRRQSEAKVDIYAKMVAEITEVSINEKEQDSFDFVKITAREPGPLKEESILPVGEIEIVLPFEPPAEPFDLSKVNEHQASVTIEELKATETTITEVEEPKEKSFDALELKEKHTQPFIEDKFLTAAETFSILFEEPRASFEINENLEQHANVEVVELKTATVTSVQVEEPKQETIKTSAVEDKDPTTAFEASLLTVAENTIVLPEGPHHGYLEIPTKDAKRPKTLIEGALIVAETAEVLPTSPEVGFNVIEVINQQARVSIKELKSITTTVVDFEEPKEEKLDVFQFQENKSQVMLQDSTLTVPTTQDILPFEPRDEDLKIPKPVEEKAVVDIEEQKNISVTFISVEEPKTEDIQIFTYKQKESESSFEQTAFSVAEILTTEPEGPLYDNFEPPALICDKAHPIVEEIKPLSINIVTPNAPQEKAMEVPQIHKYETKPIMEHCVFTVPKTVEVVPDEPSTTFDVTKVSSQQARIRVIEQKAAEATVITVSEETVDVITDLTRFYKTLSAIAKVTYEAYQPIIHTVVTVFEDVVSFVGKAMFKSSQAKIVIVESTLSNIANIISVTVSVDEGEVVDVSKYTVELADEQIEKEAPLTVDIKDIDLSSASSTISSAPSSPFVQEYVFGVATGHEYRVQSPQETSLDIKRTQKELYGFDSADASYTLTFEAAYEEEKEVLHMAEFSDTVKINKFWISDIKTMETLESSDARMQLSNVSISVIGEALKSQSKSVSVHDTAIVKSRSQSFDTSADFEVSLQTEESKAMDAEISEVQTAATINLKSETSFQTMENVESMAKVNIKSKSAKSYSEQSVDVAYGLTIEDEIEVDSQGMELDVQVSDIRVAKSGKRMVKKSAKTQADIEASYNYEAAMNVESSYAAVESSLQSSSVSEASYLAMKGMQQSSTVSRGSFASAEGSLESARVSEANLESSSIIQSSAMEMDASLESEYISKESFASSEASLSSKQAIETKSSKVGIQKMSVEKGLSKGAKIGSEQKLSLGFKETKGGIRSPSPEDIPSPLRDEYIFRLLTQEPEETTFIPRDCSFTPESVHEEPIIPVNGMIPHIDTKFVRILYSPPLDTPPTSPWKKAEPVFTKPGLKGGSETPKFTEEEILEISRKSALLASAIDKTIRSIEEYKESVGISDKTEKNDTEAERELDIEENELLENYSEQMKNETIDEEYEASANISDKTEKNDNEEIELFEISEEKKNEKTDNRLIESDVRKKDNGKRLKSILSKFSQN